MSIGYQLKACGKSGLPKTIEIDRFLYNRRVVYKHDFFAATAMYELDRQCEGGDHVAPKVILKWSRKRDFCGFPLAWLGRLINDHEEGVLKRLQGIRGIPKLIGPYREFGLLYEYVEGESLDEKPLLPDTFFDELENVIQRIHQRRVAYVDMNKRGNILLGEDGKPYMIDFQISWIGDAPLKLIQKFYQPILANLQKEDIYHLYKHKRRLRPDLMTEQEIEASRKKSQWIQWHRLLFRPFLLLRRKFLGMLYRQGKLVTDDLSQYNPETDPSRWK